MDKKLMEELSDLISLKTRSQALVEEVDLAEIAEAVVALVADAEALVAEVASEEIAEALVAEEASEVEEASVIVVAVEVSVVDVEAAVASTPMLSTKIRAILSLLLEREPHSERMGTFLLC
jgi:hypothetical protein